MERSGKEIIKHVQKEERKKAGTGRNRKKEDCRKEQGNSK